MGSFHIRPVLVFAWWWLALAFVVRVDGRRSFLVQRDGGPPPPLPLTVPVALTAGAVYSVRVNMSSNAPQAFRFALTTSTASTVVAGSACPNCGSVPSYDPTRSTSVQVLQGQPPQNVSLPGLAASGPIVREDCTLALNNGSAWAYPNQTVIVANSIAGGFRNGTSGLIGLGQAPFGGSPASEWLRKNPSQPAFQVGFALTAPPVNGSTDTDGGELHVLAPKPGAYAGDVMWLPMRALNAVDGGNGSANAPTSWAVTMDAWRATSAGPRGFNVSQTNTPLATYLDPLFPTIVFPQGAARLIYSNIPGAVPLVPSPSTNTTNAWSIPCTTRFTLTVTFGAFTTSLDQSALVGAPLEDGFCLGVLEEWADSRIGQFLLGSPFIASIYLILSYAQSGAGSVGLAHRSASNSNKLSAGAIAGVALGSVGVLALLVIAGVLLYNAILARRSSPSAVYLRAQKKAAKRAAKHETVTPFPHADSDGAQYARYPAHLGPAGSPSPRAALLPPGSPDWQIVSAVSSPDTNTFAGGTRFTYQTLGPNSVSPSHLSVESRYSTLGAGSGGPTQRISHMYRGSDDSGRPVAHSADSSLSLLSGQHPQDFDSPPPYLDASASSSSGGPAAGPVPLAPLRKGRRLS